jgi:hypothetical protein
MYHLLTGVKPPDALSRAAALVNGQDDPLLLASQANPAADGQADQVLKKAMSQNREQRYASADEMRKALHAGQQGATIRDRSEAQTVLFAPAAPTVAPTTEVVAKQPTVAAGETTVVRRGVSGQGRRALPWALSVAALLIVAVGVLGVAWKMRRSGEQLAPSPSPAPIESPSVAPTAAPTQAIAGPNTPEPEKRERKEQVAKKNEKSTTEPAPKSTPKKSEEDEEDSDRHTDPDPQVDVAMPTPPNTPRRPPRGMPNVKVLPDGSTLVVTPDGTRILTFPDGRRQIFRPPIRRNRPPGTPRPSP